MRGCFTVPATMTRMFVTLVVAPFTSYSAVACTVGLMSGVPMNSADPRVIWKRRLR